MILLQTIKAGGLKIKKSIITNNNYHKFLLLLFFDICTLL
jgi:hypothetical protein